MEHDFIKQPELRQAQLEVLQFQSPHPQILMDFDAVVVKVIDGDTIRIRTDFRDFDFPLRFLDIDAPEMNAGGEEARAWLKSRIWGKPVRILINIKNRVDKYGRLLGRVICDGFDVGDEELRLGLCKAFKARREGELPDLNKMFSLKQWF